MYSVGGGSEAISREMSSVLISSTFKNSSDLHHHNYYQQQPPQQLSSGLVRYRSAPSSFLATLVDGLSSGGGGGAPGVDGSGFDEFLNPQTSGAESETNFAGFMSGNAHDSGEIARKNVLYSTAMKQEAVESTTESNGFSSVAAGTAASQLSYEPPVSSGGSAMGNCSNLFRQNSSPAGFFSGFAAIGDVGNFRANNGTNGEVGSSNGRLNIHMNFSSGPPSSSRFMPRIAENGNEGMSSPENGQIGNDNGSSSYPSGYPENSWNESTLAGQKRRRDADIKTFSGWNPLETQNGDSRNYSPGLAHHLSLPKASSDMAAVEKFLQFQQDSVPCKIRAKRGCATHPRSIAERMRRTRISERMRKLHELFPNMDKQTNTADMLDLAVEYIKDLQKQVQTLTDTKGKCTCSK